MFPPQRACANQPAVSTAFSKQIVINFNILQTWSKLDPILSEN